MEPKLDDLAKDAADQIGGPLLRMFETIRERVAPAKPRRVTWTQEQDARVRDHANTPYQDLAQAIESDKRGLRERLLAAILRRK